MNFERGHKQLLTSVPLYYHSEGQTDSRNRRNDVTGTKEKKKVKIS